MCLSSAKKNNVQKIQELVHQKGAIKNTICDIYGGHYREVNELGLFDSTYIDDL